MGEATGRREGGEVGGDLHAVGASQVARGSAIVKVGGSSAVPCVVIPPLGSGGVGRVGVESEEGEGRGSGCVDGL